MSTTASKKQVKLSIKHIVLIIMFLIPFITPPIAVQAQSYQVVLTQYRYDYNKIYKVNTNYHGYMYERFPSHYYPYQTIRTPILTAWNFTRFQVNYSYH